MMSQQEFLGVFLGFCTCAFSVLMTMKAAQEIQQRNFFEAMQDLKRCGYATIFTWVCMLGAIINLSKTPEENNKKQNQELSDNIDLSQDRWVAVRNGK